MTTMSVSISDDLKVKMDLLDEINWSAIARKAFEEKIEQIEFLKKIAAKSKLTKKDGEEIANKINASVAKRFLEMY